MADLNDPAALRYRPQRALIGMLHLTALPGTPRARGSVGCIIEGAVAEARLLAEAGYDALILENTHDLPYLRREVGPEIVATMTAVTAAVRAEVSLPLGVQILAGANRAALAVALAGGAELIRAEGFVFSHVADEGLMEEADAGPLLRYRRAIGAEGIAVFCDLKKKHASHAITADVDLAETARAAEFFDADGVIVTGVATGQATYLEDVKAVREATRLPVLVGSGVTPETCQALLDYADGLIVGSWIKEGGDWRGALDPRRAEAMVKAAKGG